MKLFESVLAMTAGCIAFAVGVSFLIGNDVCVERGTVKAIGSESGWGIGKTTAVLLEDGRTTEARVAVVGGTVCTKTEHHFGWPMEDEGAR